jgi:3-hydroxypropanoate dehydrogenase
MSIRLNDDALNTIYRNARTYNSWLPIPVTDEMLQEIYHVAALGPTSANTSPMRLVFVKSKEAKERLKPALSPGNVDKTMAAPVCAIVANDTKFYEEIHRLFPHYPQMKDFFTGENSDAIIDEHIMRNGSMQGAYVIMAARSVGLDCGPMSGFDKKKVDAEFFPEGRIKSNFLVNIGFGDPSTLKPRLPRLTFEEACTVI